jgi:hypothetical protein
MKEFVDAHYEKDGRGGAGSEMRLRAWPGAARVGAHDARAATNLRRGNIRGDKDEQQLHFDKTMRVKQLLPAGRGLGGVGADELQCELD